MNRQFLPIRNELNDNENGDEDTEFDEMNSFARWHTRDTQWRGKSAITNCLVFKRMPQ